MCHNSACIQQSCYTPELQGEINHLQDSGPCCFCRNAHGYLAVKAPCPPQGRVQRIWPVGSAYNHTLCVVLLTSIYGSASGRLTKIDKIDGAADTYQ